jgi:hypothetical protein
MNNLFKVILENCRVNFELVSFYPKSASHNNLVVLV